MKPVDEKYIEDLLKELTLDEKLSMIHGASFFHTAGVERLNIPPLYTSDGPCGVRRDFGEKEFVPYNYSTDRVSYLPSNTCIAETFNKQLAYEAGRVLGEEARGRGKDVILAPGINIKRGPLCGRNFEYFTEDPCLDGEMAAAAIRGMQSADVSCCVKHFACNAQEYNRQWMDTEVDDRALYEIYFPAFKKAIEEGEAYSLMAAYNKLRGAHCCENRWLLNDVLRGEWNYDGCVISDWGGIHKDYEAAMAACDVEMSIACDFDQYSYAEPLKKFVEDGTVDISVVDSKVRNLLRMMYRIKMIGPDKENRKMGSVNTREHQEAALSVAREGIVLLKNEEQKLPLNRKEIRSVAVIGHNADIQHSLGGGSAEIAALYELTPLQGIMMAAGGNIRVSFAEGYYVKPKEDGRLGSFKKAMLDQDPTEHHPWRRSPEAPADAELAALRSKLLDEAIEVAQKADVVIYVGGLDHDQDVEGLDRLDLKLPYDQQHVIDELYKVRPDMVMVLCAGSPVDISSFEEKAHTLLYVPYSGMEGGRAVGEILFGDVNPSGHMAETWPKKWEDTPLATLGEWDIARKVTYKESNLVGYRYYDTKNVEPRFCFGYGLSYSDFTVESMKAVATPDGFEVTGMVRNVKGPDGAVVLQLYVSDPHGADKKKPVQELRAFTKVFLPAAGADAFKMTLKKEDFSYFDVESHSYKVIPGEYELRLGLSSRDIRSVLTVMVQ